MIRKSFRSVPVILASRLGRVRSDGGKPVEISASLDVAPAVVFDAMVLPGGDDAASAMAANGRVLEFLRDQHRHCKPILVLGEAMQVLEKAGVPATLPSGKPDPGLIVGEDAGAVGAFIKAVAKHRHYDRESEPQPVA